MNWTIRAPKASTVGKWALAGVEAIAGLLLTSLVIGAVGAVFFEVPARHGWEQAWGSERAFWLVACWLALKWLYLSGRPRSEVGEPSTEPEPTAAYQPVDYPIARYPVDLARRMERMSKGTSDIDDLAAVWTHLYGKPFDWTRDLGTVMDEIEVATAHLIPSTDPKDPTP